jgi:hypothetical protein
MTVGISNQIYAPSYTNGMSDDGWRNYSLSVLQREVAIQQFRMFLGLDLDTRPPAEQGRLTMTVPYTPAVKLVQTLSWQANDRWCTTSLRIWLTPTGPAPTSLM